VAALSLKPRDEALGTRRSNVKIHELFRARAMRIAGCASMIVLLSGAECHRGVASGGCAAEPVGSFHVFLDTVELMPPVSSVRFTAMVLEKLDPDDLGLGRVRLADTAGVQRTLAYALPGGELPLEVRARYDFQVDHAAGSPTASGLIVGDSRGLLFAAASDQQVGARVLKDGLPGFEIDIAAGGCASRAGDRCYESVRNQRLRVRRAGETVELYHGSDSTLGGYRVSALTAQAVRYREGCADAGLIAVSYAVARVDPES
jgi:hypothetical protein